MMDVVTLAFLTGPALTVLKAWLLISVPVAGLLCWLFHNADPQGEAGLSVRHHPLA